MAIAKFEFQSDVFEVDIAGKIYKIDTASDEMQAKIQSVIEMADKKTNIDDVMRACVACVDAVLGEDATEEIFKDRKVSFMDLIDLMCFLQQQIAEFKAKRVSKYASQYFNQ